MSKEQQKLNELLYVALKYKDYERAEKFISEGADVNGTYIARDEYIDELFIAPLLYFVVEHGHIEGLKLLLKHGVDIDVSNGRASIYEYYFENVMSLIEDSIEYDESHKGYEFSLLKSLEMKSLLTEYKEKTK